MLDWNFYLDDNDKMFGEALCKWYSEQFMHRFKINMKLQKPFILCSDAELMGGKKNVRFATLEALMEYVEAVDNEAQADVMVDKAATVADNSMITSLEEATEDSVAPATEILEVTSTHNWLTRLFSRFCSALYPAPKE